MKLTTTNTKNITAKHAMFSKHKEIRSRKCGQQGSSEASGLWPTIDRK